MLGAQKTGLAPVVRTSYFEYDFSIHGGAISAIAVKGNPISPGAVIKSAVIQVKIAPVGVGASVAIMAAGAGDILAETAITSLTAGLVTAVPDGTTSTTMVLNGATHLESLTFTITDAALTAGVITAELTWVQ